MLVLSVKPCHILHEDRAGLVLLHVAQCMADKKSLVKSAFAESSRAKGLTRSSKDVQVGCVTLVVGPVDIVVNLSRFVNMSKQRPATGTRVTTKDVLVLDTKSCHCKKRHVHAAEVRAHADD